MVYGLNRMSYQFAQKLIKNHLIVIDRDVDWVDHKPSRTKRRAFFDTYGPVQYGKWHLGEDEDVTERSFKRFAFLFGDFLRMHRCALIAAEAEVRRSLTADGQKKQVSVYSIMFDALLPLIWTIVVGFGWLLGVTMQIAAVTIARLRKADPSIG